MTPIIQGCSILGFRGEMFLNRHGYENATGKDTFLPNRALKISKFPYPRIHHLVKRISATAFARFITLT